MLSITSILQAVLNDLESQSENILVVDDMHIIDKLSGVEYHLYDDYFQMTRDSDKPVSVSSFTDAEKALVMQIKNTITDPEVTRDKQENYQHYISGNRERFSGWYENPKPIHNGVQEESDTEEYSRY